MSLKEKLEKKLKQQAKKVVPKGLGDLPNPSELKNAVAAARGIIDRLQAGQKMLIVGDYDADGIMATTVMYSFLRDVGLSKNVDYLIPSRLVDGYGMSPNIVGYAKDREADFIVTVDNGIAAVDAIALSNEEGIPVYITDHHTAPAVLPNAEVIVNPKQPGETFPFKEISGATVAWYVCAAMRELLGAQIDMRKYLDFVGITVISDVMPLTDINIGLFRYALAKIKKQERYFYKLLWRDFEAPYLDETDFGFSLVPMINAIGRIDDANIGVQLFTSQDQKEITDLFLKLKRVNEERKMASRAATQEAEAYALMHEATGKPAIVVRGEFHEGLVGIIAGRLAEKYQRPAYVFSWNEEKGIWKGSARTSGEVHLYNLTNEAAEHILGFGGHKGACGMSVAPEKFEAFEAALVEAASKIPEKDFVSKEAQPILCDLYEFSEEILDLMDSYAPFGQGNPKPIFRTRANRKIEIHVENEMKGGLHFNCILTQKGVKHDALFFNVEREEFLEDIQKPRLSITFQPSRKVDWRTRALKTSLISKIYHK